jgi:hypothetical protein
LTKPLPMCARRLMTPNLNSRLMLMKQKLSKSACRYFRF